MTTIALVGAPNAGKTTLFNGLTGGRGRVANYAGVTVERREGLFQTPKGKNVSLIDLPGIYGLSSRSTDARIAVQSIQGQIDNGPNPDLLLVVIDAAQIRTHLQTALQMRTVGRPMAIVLNMIDLAERDGLELDVPALESALGVPVVTSRATRTNGREALLNRLDEIIDSSIVPPPEPEADLKSLQKRAREICQTVIKKESTFNRLTRQVDSLVLHPVSGPIILTVILFLMFQAVFAWSSLPMDLIEGGFAALASFVDAQLPDGLFKSLITDGIIGGVGSVLVFLPQIVILFAFILILEASGYLARAAFMLDEIMVRVGLNGRAFIPLLSSFACAIPGIMATRTMDNERDRLTTIMIAPLMTCSARLPVYALIIAAFIPPKSVWIFNQQGLVLFGLYIAAVISAVIVAFILKRTVTAGSTQPLVMELPTYKMPQPRDFFLGLWGRISAFLRRAGTVIFGTSVALWFLATFPMNSSLRDSFAGQIGRIIEPVLTPIGFNLEIAIALIPGMAAREVAVGSLGTIYAIENAEENAFALAETLQSAWSMPTALAFLAWYVFAPQCFATLAATRRETNSWGWTGFMFAYLVGTAYVAAGITYWTATAVGL